MRPESHWRPTPALQRAMLVGALGAVGGVLLERPAAVVVGAPFLLLAALGLRGRPTREPRVSSRLDHDSVQEGQATTSRLLLEDDEDVEHVTRVLERARHVVLDPPAGRLGRLRSAGVPVVVLGPRRWGRRELGAQSVALTTAWGGYRWGPTPLPAAQLRVLPTSVPYTSRGEAPRPRGLVGQHRSVRQGTGTEFSGIRPFTPGDRLRRISWRVSSRSERLHVTTTRAEEDTALLLVVDAATDLGASGGLGGAVSSLDQGVRAAAAVAEHALRQGDRVALRVVSGDGAQVAAGTGRGHLRRILGALAGVRPRGLADGQAGRLRLATGEGTVVVLFSPLLGDHVPATAMTLLQRGVPTLVVDTLPPDVELEAPRGADQRLVDLAWRMRRLEREATLRALAGRGCPVVGWHGAGTLDEVLRRLARHAALPRVPRR